MTTDTELVRRVLLLNDKQSYSDLVRKYQVEVRSYLLRLVHDREQANDLAQETFLLGYRRLNQLKEAGKFRSWIYTIAHHQFLQWYRSVRTTENIDSIPDVAVTSDVFARAEIVSLFRHLRPEECSALTLCLGQDFSHAEASEVLGIPVGTVKSFILRAREKIGALYESTK